MTNLNYDDPYRPRILLGVSGSVAAKLTPLLIKELQVFADVKMVVTKAAKYMLRQFGYPFAGLNPEDVYDDESEWQDGYEIGFPIPHIMLRDWADSMVVAPATYNTISKFKNGIADNLLTNIYAAWNRRTGRPIVIAPAMNTEMWNNLLSLHDSQPKDGSHRPVTNDRYVYPQNKNLACGDIGYGAMAEIHDIVNQLTPYYGFWQLPLGQKYTQIPVKSHPGSFGYVRRKNVHTGVDIYCTKDAQVLPVEDGVIVGRGQFTGSGLGHTWWNDTEYLMIAGRSGVVCYGEIVPQTWAVVGQEVRTTTLIGRVAQVLKDGHERPDIPGHSLSMLHLELYTPGTKEPVDWELNSPKPANLRNPTNFLLSATTSSGWGYGGVRMSIEKLTWDNPENKTVG